MVKQFTPQRKAANQGISYVQKIVDEMNYVWRPVPNDDVGLDGEIELSKDGTATAKLLKAQIKSGSSYKLRLVRRRVPTRESGTVRQRSSPSRQAMNTL